MDDVSNIHRMNPDGTGREQLTQNDNPYVVFHSMDVSPDGRQVVMHSNHQGCPGNRVMDADGSNVRRLTDHVSDDELPDGLRHHWTPWSPDGAHVAFFDRDGVVQVIRPDGTGYRQLTSEGAEFAGWSPDGRVTFVQDGDVHLVGVDGSGVVNITNSPEEHERNVLWTRRM